MRSKGLIGFTVVALAMLAVLIGLGVWQLKRLHWKEGLIAAINARTKGDPISLDRAIALAKEGRDPTYYRVHVEGRFDNSKERYLFSQSISDGTPGWHVITPFRTTQGELVLVDRGFVPDNLKDLSTRASGQIEGVTTVTAIARRLIFTPRSDFWSRSRTSAAVCGRAAGSFSSMRKTRDASPTGNFRNDGIVVTPAFNMLPSDDLGNGSAPFSIS